MADQNDTYSFATNPWEETKFPSIKTNNEQLAVEKKHCEPPSSLFKVKSYEEPQSALLKRKSIKSFESKRSVGPPDCFSDSISTDTRYTSEKIDNENSTSCKDFSLLSQESNLKPIDLTAQSDVSGGDDLSQFSGKANFLANFFQFDEYYERADSFLDFQNLLIVIPGEEHRPKKFVKVLSKHHSLEGAQLDYTTSPTLSKVCSSSLLIRRQNSPMLKPMDSPPSFMLNLQKSASLPLTPSRFEDLFKEKTPKTLEKEMMEEENKYTNDNSQTESIEPRKTIKVSTGFKNPLLKLHTNKLNAVIGKIIEENSPASPTSHLE